MEKSNFALRLLPSLLKAAQRVAERESCSVNQLINVALAEKLAVLDADHFRQRKQVGAQMSTSDIEHVLSRLGSGNQPLQDGDELPPGFHAEKLRKRKGHKALSA